MNDRFKTDLLLYRNNLKEDDQEIIKNLNEELTNLKSQMKYVYEKDKIINQLKIQLSEMEKLIKKYSIYKDKIKQIEKDLNDAKQENKYLSDTNMKLKKIIIKLEKNKNLENEKEINMKSIVMQCLLNKEKNKIEKKLENIEINEENIEDVIEDVIDNLK